MSHYGIFKSCTNFTTDMNLSCFEIRVLPCCPAAFFRGDMVPDLWDELLSCNGLTLLEAVRPVWGWGFLRVSQNRWIFFIRMCLRFGHWRITKKRESFLTRVVLCCNSSFGVEASTVFVRAPCLEIGGLKTPAKKITKTPTPSTPSKEMSYCLRWVETALNAILWQ